jgi:hypothetical protein
LLIFTLLLVLFLPSRPVFAYENVNISINGESRYFSPSPQIVNGRTMVPIRFIVEDKALQGQVNWEPVTGKVTIACQGKSFEFVIGSRRVVVNGAVSYMDVSPYIYNNRTFVPLRFIAENLGAVVGWRASSRQVTINLDHHERVFAYYYRNFSEMQANADLFDDVAFRWFETNGNGDLFYEYDDDYAQILAFAHSHGIKCHASVVFMDKDGLHELLSNPSNRIRLVNNLVTRVNNDGYDGVNIDFEFIPSTDSGLYTTFLTELKNALGNKTLSAAVFARTGQEKWATGYDYDGIGRAADLVVVMAYDYSYKTSAPGPVAPLWWVRDVAAYMSAHMSPSKILLGLPTYGYDWSTGLSTDTVTLSKLNSIKEQYQVSERFDTASMSPCYTYTDSNNNSHQIWLENQQSLQEKWNVAVDYNLAGISFWRIGNGFTDLYKV